jgi:hypothetical protein
MTFFHEVAEEEILSVEVPQAVMLFEQIPSLTHQLHVKEEEEETQDRQVL